MTNMEVTKPATEADIASVCALGGEVAEIVRKLAFERDELKRRENLKLTHCGKTAEEWQQECAKLAVEKFNSTSIRLWLYESIKQEQADYDRFTNGLDRAVRAKAYWRMDALKQALMKLDELCSIQCVTHRGVVEWGTGVDYFYPFSSEPTSASVILRDGSIRINVYTAGVDYEPIAARKIAAAILAACDEAERVK